MRWTTNYRILDKKNDELAARNVQLNKIQEIALGIEEVRTADEAGRLVVKLAGEIPGVSFVSIQQLDESKNGLVIQFHSALRDRGVTDRIKALGLAGSRSIQVISQDEHFHLTASGMPFIQGYFKSPQTRTIDRLSEILDGGFTRELCDSVQEFLHIRQCVIMPLSKDDQSFGAVMFALDGEVPIDILDMVRMHCSLAFHKIHTLQSLAKRNQELSAVNLVAANVLKSLEISQIIDGTIKETKRLFSAGGVSIYLLDEEAHLLRLAGQYGMPEEIEKQSRAFPINHTFGRIISSSEPLFAGKIYEYLEQFNPGLSIEKPDIPVWFVTAPLIMNSKRSGTITVLRPSKTDFWPEEKELLIAIANQLSVAFENAGLHQNLKQRIKDLETAQTRLSQSEQKMRSTLRSVSDGIMVTSLDGRIQTANEAAIKMHGFDVDDSFYGKTSLRYVDGSDRRRMLENLKKIKNTG